MRTRRITFIALLVLVSQSVFGQSFNLELSPKHASKLTTIKSGHKRMVKFYKYYKKDSTLLIRKQNRLSRKQLDSTFRTVARSERLRRSLARKGIVMPGRIPINDSLDLELKRWYAVMKDSSSVDSVRRHATAKVKELAMAKAKLYPGFQQLQERYHLGGDSIRWQDVAAQVPGLDTLKGIYESSPQQLFDVGEKQLEGEFVRRTGLGDMNRDLAELEEPKELKTQYEQSTDRANVEQHVKQMATDQIGNLPGDHAEKLGAAQKMVSKLLGKYADIANSDNLNNAVKRTSLQGKTFWERLIFGGTFNILSTDPFAIDFSPRLGYKFTTRFVAGLGMNYRHTFGDSLKYNWYVSARNTSFNAFTSYDVIKGFFGYAEWERSGTTTRSRDLSGKRWRDNYFVGIGKKVRIHPMIYLTSMFLYNLNAQEKNPSHPTRWQFRVGLQLSELATRKERPVYDPNR